MTRQAAQHPPAPDRHRRRVTLVTTHVIQYQAPFFRLLAEDPELDIEVLFCSRAGSESYRDEDMKTTLRWDLDLLSGYRHRFLTNLSRQSTSAGFWRAVNPGIVATLWRGRHDLVIFMMGWGVASAWLGFGACRVRGLPFYLYGDSSFVPEVVSTRDRIRARLMRWLVRSAEGFFVSGALNREYYLHYGADPERFFEMPWAIDNHRFEEKSRLSPDERTALRSRLGFGPEAVVFLFSGKLIERKDPLALVRAVEKLPREIPGGALFLGDGVMRSEIERYCGERGLSAVRFAGFVNQEELPRYYAAADVFVLPSWDDPRATVVNEAMAVGLPIVLSDRCGPARDIVADGDNGFVVPAGDVDALADRFARLGADAELRGRMGRRSRERIEGWDYATGVEGVKRAIRHLESRRGRRAPGDATDPRRS